MRKDELRKRAIQKTKKRIKEELIRRDRVIVHVVKTMDTIDKMNKIQEKSLLRA